MLFVPRAGAVSNMTYQLKVPPPILTFENVQAIATDEGINIGLPIILFGGVTVVSATIPVL